MIHTAMVRIPMQDRLSCYGEFDIADPICKKYCALRIRCAVEKDQSARLEIIEDLVYNDTSNIPTQ